MAIVNLKQISKVQPMREGEISTVDTVNAMLASFPLQTADIGDLAITTNKLAANAVTAEKLADDSVDTAAIQNASVTTEKLAANAVTAEKLADDSVDTAAIQNASVTTEKLAANAVGSSAIQNASVTTEKLAAGSVTIEKLETTLNKIVSSIPDIEIGITNSFNVDAGKYIDFGIPFATAKANMPVIFCEIQQSFGTSDERLLEIIISVVAKDHFSVRILNTTAINIVNATLGWLAITRR